jgi:hypothetical protein
LKTRHQNHTIVSRTRVASVDRARRVERVSRRRRRREPSRIRPAFAVPLSRPPVARDARVTRAIATDDDETYARVSLASPSRASRLRRRVREIARAPMIVPCAVVPFFSSIVTLSLESF